MPSLLQRGALRRQRGFTPQAVGKLLGLFLKLGSRTPKKMISHFLSRKAIALGNQPCGIFE